MAKHLENLPVPTVAEYFDSWQPKMHVKFKGNNCVKYWHDRLAYRFGLYNVVYGERDPVPHIEWLLRQELSRMH